MYTLSNHLLQIQVAAKGAELKSIHHTINGLEYMWGAGPQWPKTSPVLFPVVGGLKQNQYSYNGKKYTMRRHGFARDSMFELTGETANSLVFSLSSDDDTLKYYPFEFTFLVQYTLHENTVEVTYTVMNKSEAVMLFSVGAHPAFNVPLVADSAYEDYYLEFEHAETCGIFPLSKEGLIEPEATPLLNNSKHLPITRQLFAADALVFKTLASKTITLKSDKTAHGLTVHFNGFPYMGIWAAKNADFVCIEPWCGIADNVTASGDLADKEGINELAAHEVFVRSFTIEIF